MSLCQRLWQKAFHLRQRNMKYFVVLIVFLATLAICSAQNVSCGGNLVPVCEYKMFYIPRNVIISSGKSFLYYLYCILYLSARQNCGITRIDRKFSNPIISLEGQNFSSEIV